MKNNVLTVMKKEFSRIFGDRKLFFATVILPGLMIFLMYTLMGSFMQGIMTVDEEYEYQIYAVNLPESIAPFLENAHSRMSIRHIPESDIERATQQVTNRLADLLVVFPAYFDEVVPTFDPQAGQRAPNVQVWANFARTESSEANSIVTGILQFYHHELTHRFTINAPTDDAYYADFNLATDADMFAMIMGMIVPMLFILFIFTGCQAIAPESIAGEKERGTLGSLLVTPANRRDIALGKVLAVGFFALLGAGGSVVAMFFSMPNMMGLEDSLWGFFSIADILLLLVISVSTTLVFVGILSVLSAYAKSVKEATAYSMPIMLVVFVAGVAGMILGGVPDGVWYYFIPVFNSSLALAAIFSFEVNIANILIAAGVNLVVALLLVVVLAKIFSSEKIVFDK